MTPTQDPGSRSGAVRSTARSHLAQIRQSRLARRAAAAPPAEAPAKAPASAPAGAAAVEPLRTIESVAAEILTAGPDPVPAPLPAGPPAVRTAAAEPPPPVLRQPAVPADSSLFALPGAGSGLVWMLRSSGIETLEDLAAADADRLSADLGLIGQILDIRDWIAFARAQAASR